MINNIYVETKKIDNNILSLIKSFQQVIKLVYSYTKDKNKDEEKFIDLYNKLLKYKDLPFMSDLNNILSTIYNDINEIGSLSNNKNDLYINFNNEYAKYKQLLQQPIDFSKIKEQANSMYDTTIQIIKVINGKNKEINKFINPFNKNNNWLFGDPNAILSKFDDEDMQTVINTNYDEYCYSYLKIPNPSNINWFINFILQLRNSNNPVPIKSNKEFMKYQKYLYNEDKEFIKMLDLIEMYMHNNNKNLIDEILLILPKYKDLYNLNEYSKNTIKQVYRGISGDGEYPPQKVESIIINKDKNEKYVATALSKYSALNFARHKGHLDAERHNNWGVVLTYGCDYSSIVLDINIFGSLYGEGEVVINPSKANIIEFEIDSGEIDSYE